MQSYRLFTFCIRDVNLFVSVEFKEICNQQKKKRKKKLKPVNFAKARKAWYKDLGQEYDEFWCWSNIMARKYQF